MTIKERTEKECEQCSSFALSFFAVLNSCFKPRLWQSRATPFSKPHPLSPDPRVPLQASLSTPAAALPFPLTCSLYLLLEVKPQYLREAGSQKCHMQPGQIAADGLLVRSVWPLEMEASPDDIIY